jgi:hypothetical protein
MSSGAATRSGLDGVTETVELDLAGTPVFVASGPIG